MEIFNELTILVSAYHLLLFTDFVPEDLYYNLGWSLIISTLLNILVNLAVMCVQTYWLLKAFLKGII